MRAIEVREGGSNPLAARLRSKVLGQGEEVLHRVMREGASQFGGPDRAMLEALVSLTDRPAVRIENDRIDRNHPELGPWKDTYALSEAEINATFLSVGRIDADGDHIEPDSW